MANQAHLNLLLRGKGFWDQWRWTTYHHKIELDLRGVDLSEATLIGNGLNKLVSKEVTLGGVDLAKADLTDVNMEGSNLFRADLRGADLSGANLTSADLSEANLIGADLSYANLTGAYLREARLTGAILHGTKLKGIAVASTDFSEVRFDRVDLRGIRLGEISGASFDECNFSGEDLTRVNLANKNLRRSNLSRSNLKKSSLSGSNLTKVNLSGANLAGADLSYANLQEAILRDANLSSAIFHETFLVSTDLTDAIGLDSCRHYGPSFLDIQTLIKSRLLPVKFLRGCGLTDIFIEYFPSLLTEPIQFHSCFISYSSKNQKFAERLYADLQNKGIRCWFAPENLKIGDKSRNRIDESIRIHDKLLLILSKHSVSSDWVEQEVETALAREREEKRTVLFPISLDDAVMKFNTGWPALIRNTRHIGNFRNWQDHSHYQSSFNRLLRDLKIEPLQIQGDLLMQNDL